MLGDNFRRLQADELDADWDRLVENHDTSTDSTLASIVAGLSAHIPDGAPGAKERVWQQLFAGQPERPARAAQNLAAHPVQLLPNPPISLPASSRKRWWSSPMAAVEALVACLVIAALAVGISAYQSGNHSASPSRLMTASSSTPAVVSTPDLRQPNWNEINEMRADAQPTIASSSLKIGAGKIWLDLSEIFFPAGTGYSVEYTGATLIAVVSGAITLTTDSGAPVLITAGDSAFSSVKEQYSIENAGSETAYVIQGIVASETASDCPLSGSPTALNCYPASLGDVQLDLPTDYATISLEVLDETTVNREVQSDATELLLNRLDPISIEVDEGGVGIRGAGPDVTSDEYSTGSGYSPVSLGSTIIIGGMSDMSVLVQPGARYSLSAPVDSQIMAISLRVSATTP